MAKQTKKASTAKLSFADALKLTGFIPAFNNAEQPVNVHVSTIKAIGPGRTDEEVYLYTNPTGNPAFTADEADIHEALEAMAQDPETEQ